ncbi:MAG: putative 2-aminoethylphosphonate ABC transporter permease subunit, partial [Burkholderiales bacterium]|nr:putative 2-aminoethylphosphonate ABC transporter permease subunit [Burkholderiales bacterium]
MTTAVPSEFATKPAKRMRIAVSSDARIAQLVGWFVAALLVIFIACPLVAILAQAVMDADGHFDGFAQARTILSDPRLADSIAHSAFIAVATTLVVIPMAFTFAFALCRTRIWGRGPLKLMALTPMLAPSLMPAISLIYLFGNQGPLKAWLGSYSLYGPIGIVMGEAFYTFPHALLVILSALALADARLYEAAETLGA